MPRSTKMLAAALGAITLSALVLAQDGEKKKSEPKHKIKDVMKGAMMKDGLNKKVMSGEATTEEKLALLDMFVSLVENKPPRGDMGSWQKLSGGVALAAAKVAVGREGAEAELKAATSCKACHDQHKPKKKE